MGKRRPAGSLEPRGVLPDQREASHSTVWRSGCPARFGLRAAPPTPLFKVITKESQKPERVQPQPGTEVPGGYAGRLPETVSPIGHFGTGTLFPGGLIFSGTSGKTKEIKLGDVVGVEISGMGALRDPVSLVSTQGGMFGNSPSARREGQPGGPLPVAQQACPGPALEGRRARVCRDSRRNRNSARTVAECLPCSCRAHP